MRLNILSTCDPQKSTLAPSSHHLHTIRPNCDGHLRPLRRTRSGNKYVLVIMDYATKWPKAFPLRNITSETIIECLIEVTSRLGVPKEVLSDNGTNFVSTMMRQFCDRTGIHQIKTSPYHPQTDGMVERFNSTLKRLLRKLTQKGTMEWDKCLPFILWAYRGSIHKSTSYSSYELMFGRTMRTPLDELVEMWSGKNKDEEHDVVEYLHLLRERMSVVKRREKRESSNSTTIKRRQREGLGWVIMSQETRQAPQ